MWKTLERRYDRNEYKFFPVEVNGIKYEITHHGYWEGRDQYGNLWRKSEDEICSMVNED